MITLKSVIRYAPTNSVEATWVGRIQLPDVEVPEVPATFDEEGNEITPYVPARTEAGAIQETQVRCHSYDQTQMDMLTADLGADAPAYADLIQEVEDNFIPPPVIPKADIQEAKWTAIKHERDRRTQNGVKVGTDWFHSDTFSRTQQLGLTMMGASMPAGIMWKTMDAGFVQMTPTLAGQIFNAVAVSDNTLFTAAEMKRSEMMALDDPTNYDVSTGWPETHDE